MTQHFYTRGDSARTMTKFAAAMMRALATLKAKSEPKMPDFQLRIGKIFQTFGYLLSSG